MLKNVTIGVSEQVKRKLDEIKERDGHKSIDSVIRYLLYLDERMTVKATFERRNESAEDPVEF